MRTYEENIGLLRELIATMVPSAEDVSSILKELNEIDWQSTIASARIPWKECASCGIAYRAKQHSDRATYCPECRTDKRLVSEARVVGAQCYRAIVSGCESTLTVKEWLETLNFFNWKCAYCLEAPYEEMEHFIPVIEQGGTTKDNCVPSCHRCNMLKANINIKTTLSQEARERVANYLYSVSNKKALDDDTAPRPAVRKEQEG